MGGGESAMKFVDFQLAETVAIDADAYERSHRLPSLQSRCAGIDVEHGAVGVGVRAQTGV